VGGGEAERGVGSGDERGVGEGTIGASWRGAERGVLRVGTRGT
jgi:hypothetical protein